MKDATHIILAHMQDGGYLPDRGAGMLAQPDDELIEIFLRKLVKVKISG